MWIIINVQKLSFSHKINNTTVDYLVLNVTIYAIFHTETTNHIRFEEECK